MNDMTGMNAFARMGSPDATNAPVESVEIGRVMDIAGSSSQITLDSQTLAQLQAHPDPSIAAAGQVGSQVKLKVDERWLIANIRSMRLAEADGDLILAQMDFLGEGDEDPRTGKLVHFRRGVTRYPIPGCRIFPVSNADMKQMFAADERAHIEIGTIYPTKDIRGALYVDAMLGKHFALLGSTGTGKSTSAALILHRICELAPEGHIVMIDPHGE
jgi:hypothetical protein